MALDFDFNERPEDVVKPSPGIRPAAQETAPEASQGEPRSFTPQKHDTPNKTGFSLSNVAEEVKQTETANHAALGSLSGLKVLGNALSGLLYHSKGLSEAQLDEKLQAMLEHFAEQSIKLHDKLNLPEARYVRESVTGSLAKIISQHYRVAGEKALQMDWSASLSKLAEIEGVWEPGKSDDEWASLSTRRSMAMMQALSPVMSAYQSWNYHHADSEPVMQQLGDLMWRTTDDALNRHPVAEKMSEREREILRYNLLYRAGELMSNAWYANIRETLAELAALPAEDRRYYQANGYPLDKIERSFQESAELLHSGLSVSLSVHSGMPERNAEADQAESVEDTLRPG